MTVFLRASCLVWRFVDTVARTLCLITRCPHFSLHSQRCQQPLPPCCLLQRYFHFILWITLSNWNCSMRKACPFYPCPLTFELLTYTLWTPGYVIIQPFHDLFCSSKGSAFELFHVGCYRKGRPWCPGVTNGLMLVNG